MEKKKVLLARPSVFIVNEMKPFIEVCDFEPRPLKDLTVLDKVQQSQIAGTVISTAINSDVKETLREVADRVRSRFPSMPIILATLVDFDQLVKSLEIKFEGFHEKMTFLPLSEASKKPLLMPKNQIIVIHKNDIDNDSKRRQAAQTVRRFFY